MTSSPEKVSFLKWGEHRIDWTENVLPLADKFGWHRGHYGAISGTNVRARVVSLPFGQSSPPHSVGHETVIFQLEGEVVFVVGADHQRFDLSRYDALFIPKEMVYEYWNSGKENVLFLVVGGKVGEWATHSTYFLPGQPEPFRRAHSTPEKSAQDPPSEL